MTEQEIIGLIAAGAVGTALQQLRQLDSLLPEIQAKAGCSQGRVAQIQNELATTSKLTIPETRTGADGKQDGFLMNSNYLSVKNNKKVLPGLFFQIDPPMSSSITAQTHLVTNGGLNHAEK